MRRTTRRPWAEIGRSRRILRERESVVMEFLGVHEKAVMWEAKKEKSEEESERVGRKLFANYDGEEWMVRSENYFDLASFVPGLQKRDGRVLCDAHGGLDCVE